MHASPHFTLPPIVSTLDPGSVKGLKQSANPKASTGATSNGSSGGDLSTTFLNVLATELQNQDPTAPVDSTAFVGQLISLNSLDQLISINQTLAGSSTTPTTTSPQPASAASLAAPAVAAPNQLPFNLDTMMPVDPALYPTPFNNTTGGK